MVWAVSTAVRIAWMRYCGEAFVDPAVQAFHKSFHLLRGHQSNHVSQRLKFTCQILRTATGLHGNHRGFHCWTKKGNFLCATFLLKWTLPAWLSAQTWNTCYAKSIPLILYFLRTPPFLLVVKSTLVWPIATPIRGGAHLITHNLWERQLNVYEYHLDIPLIIKINEWMSRKAPFYQVL